MEVFRSQCASYSPRLQGQPLSEVLFFFLGWGGREEWGEKGGIVTGKLIFAEECTPMR